MDSIIHHAKKLTNLFGNLFGRKSKILRGIGKVLGAILASTIIIGIVGGIYFIFLGMLAFIIDWSVGFLFQYDIGFWKTLVGLILLWIVSRIILPNRTGGND